MLSEKFEVFENLIRFYLCDPDADIKDCRIEENDLDYKNREMEILLKRKPNNEGAPIGSYAIPEA